jgi:solute carrier family 13 (sodium-dependent dicarboxylate transporter), member 2/3/5
MRQRVGAVLAPIVFLFLLAFPLPTLSPAAHRLAGVLAAVVVLWVTEALPLTASVGSW